MTTHYDSKEPKPDLGKETVMSRQVESITIKGAGEPPDPQYIADVVSALNVSEAEERANSLSMIKAAAEHWASGRPAHDEHETEVCEVTPDHFIVIVRRITMMGFGTFRCGYVGLPTGHPWHGKGYDDIGADAHGGLTFAESGSAISWVTSHLEHWYIGFDTAHHGDDEHTTSLEYVRAQCEKLLAQARAAQVKTTP